MEASTREGGGVFGSRTWAGSIVLNVQPRAGFVRP